MKHLSFAFTLLLFAVSASAQSGDILSRLSGIRNNGVDFYSIDGIEITTQTINGDFIPKNIRKKVKRFKLKDEELISADPKVKQPNYYVSKPTLVTEGVTNYSHFYIIKRPEHIAVITFSANNKEDRQLEYDFIDLYMAKAIPDSVYGRMQPDSIVFAGRGIKLGTACRWMGVNNVQCPGNGQMNWSLHKSLEDAQLAIDNHFKIIKYERKGKIVKDEMVDVLFENTPAKARKIIFDFKGVTSALVGMNGAKTMTIYFVAAPVRGKYVSSVMSFWDIDFIHPNGLAPLADEVMDLQN